jgi:hypothetical protein
MNEQAQPGRDERERSFVLVGLLFVVMTPVFVPAAAGALGVGFALARRGSTRRAAIVTIPAVFVLVVTLISLLK